MNWDQTKCGNALLIVNVRKNRSVNTEKTCWNGMTIFFLLFPL